MLRTPRQDAKQAAMLTSMLLLRRTQGLPTALQSQRSQQTPSGGHPRRSARSRSSSQSAQQDAGARAPAECFAICQTVQAVLQVPTSTRSEFGLALDIMRRTNIFMLMPLASGLTSASVQQRGLLTSMPSRTSPKTQCLPSSHGVSTVVMKNWLPLVLGPALAMLSRPGFSCFSWKFSSANVLQWVV